MKIIFLNTWGGKMKEVLTDFIKEQSRDTDVFCFQEVYPEMAALAQELLPEYAVVEKYKHVDADDNFPQATYVKKTLPIMSSGTIMENEPRTGLGIYVELSHQGKNIYICNFHGMSRPADKLDNPSRLRQSELLINFFKDKNASVVIGGDFNTLPDTKNVQMFSGNGYKDLIKNNKIATTRNQLAWASYPNNIQYHSDYVFTSGEVMIKNFSVPSNEISDHLPLILEIE